LAKKKPVLVNYDPTPNQAEVWGYLLDDTTEEILFGGVGGLKSTPFLNGC